MFLELSCRCLVLATRLQVFCIIADDNVGEFCPCLCLEQRTAAFTSQKSKVFSASASLNFWILKGIHLKLGSFLLSPLYYRNKVTRKPETPKGPKHGLKGCCFKWTLFFHTFMRKPQAFYFILCFKVS